jgi:hypothetical protein
MRELRVSGFSLPRKWPTLATIRLSRRWGTRLWWFGQMWATRPEEVGRLAQKANAHLGRKIDGQDGQL